MFWAIVGNYFGEKKHHFWSPYPQEKLLYGRARSVGPMMSKFEPHNPAIFVHCLGLHHADDGAHLFCDWVPGCLLVLAVTNYPH